MTTTTGTTLGAYMEWLRAEAEKKQFGKVGITFTITRGQITDVEQVSIDHTHRPLAKEDSP